MAATQKTLTPTNEVISIPAFADKPDYRLPIDSTGKLADAINALDGNTAPKGSILNISQNFDCAANTLAYTGVSFTIPAKSEYSIRCECQYTNTAPSEIIVSSSSSSHSAYETEAFGSAICSLSGYNNSSSARTMYIWGKWSNAGTNKVIIDGITRPINA